MADATGDIVLPSAGEYPHVLSIPVEANELIRFGATVCVNAAGNAVEGADGEGFRAVGKAKAEADNRTTAPEGGGAGAIYVEVECGIFARGLHADSDTPTLGALVFVAGNQDVSTSSDTNARGIAGQAIKVEGSFVYVYMGPQVVGLATITALSETNLTQAMADIDTLEANAVTAQACIPIPLAAWLADGVPLVAFADGTQNGVELTDSEVAAFRWNPVDDDTSTLSTTIPMPQDLDDTADVVVHALVARVGSDDETAALVGNAFFQTVGAEYDADADAIASNSAAVDGATKVVHELTLTVAAADVPAAPCALTVTLTPSSALDDDDLLLLAAWVEYTRKVLAA